VPPSTSLSGSLVDILQAGLLLTFYRGVRTLLRATRLGRPLSMHQSLQAMGIRDKIRRLTAHWPVAMLGFSVVLTLGWFGALTFGIFYLMGFRFGF
jgi:hypothetical protein